MSAKRDDNSYLLEAKQRLLDIFQNQSIFQQPRESALYHFCAVLEVEEFKAAAKPKGPLQRTSGGSPFEYPSHIRYL